MPRPLPPRPSLRQLKIQSRELLRQLRLDNQKATLAHAQLLIARQYGFPAWQSLHAHVEQLTDDRVAQLQRTFRDFAALECRGRSPSYECWANHIADDLELLHIAAFGRAPIPNLLFATVHLLVLQDPTTPLARHFASIDRDPLPREQGWPRFREFCLDRRPEIVRILRTRTTQTNEVRRSAYLAAAFNIVWNSAGKKPLALLEIGTSSGLNLCFDKYAFRIAGNVYGDARSPVLLDIESRGPIPPPLAQHPLPVAQRIGIDLRPITADDDEGILWLNALIWPEHHDRRRELTAAIQLSRAVPLQLIAGDAVAILADVLRAIPMPFTICLFQTHCFNQIPAQGRQKLMSDIKACAQDRPVYFVSRHNNLTLETFHPSGDHSSLLLAETDPHGRWIEWLQNPAVPSL